MTRCLFASDLHGQVDRYGALFRAIEERRPKAVFLGGDLLPSGFVPVSSIVPGCADFIYDYLARQLELLRGRLGAHYPRIFVILGNDDERAEEAAILDVAARGLWTYAHDRHLRFGVYTVYGYAYVPPTPFRLKDWERYDVSRYVDPGCVSPEEGARTVPVSEREARYATIEEDLTRLAGNHDLSRSIWLCHSPPYQTKLDRAALDGKMIDHAPLDVHVGSIALRRFIEARQPLLTLHGHVHESARLTAAWRDRLGVTQMFSAAHDDPELALVEFSLERLVDATRELL